jgi:hypothetical protein
MLYMRRASKVDDNHAEVVKALRKIGAKVVDLSRVGGGVPDLLVGIAGKWLLIEVKDGAKTASRRRLTPAQARWHLEHAGLPAFVVTSPHEAIRAVMAICDQRN